MITRPRELVRQCLGGEHGIRLCFLLFIEGVGFGTKAPREIGRFDKRPYQVGVTVPGVAQGLGQSIPIEV